MLRRVFSVRSFDELILYIYRAEAQIHSMPMIQRVSTSWPLDHSLAFRFFPPDLLDPQPWRFEKGSR